MNILQYVPKGVSTKIARQVLITQKHSPTIMFATGIAGFVGTAVLASRATLKLYDVIEQTQADLETAKNLEHEDYSEHDRQRDKTIIYTRTGLSVVKLYAPAIGVGVLSIGLLTGSHIVLNRRNAGLTAAYAAVERGFAEYRERVVDKYGADEDENLRYAATERQVVVETDKGGKPVNVMQATHEGRSIYARIFDEGNKNWNRQYGYNQLFIQSQQNYANDRLRAYGHLLLNDVYDMLGFPRTPEGCVVGWILPGMVGEHRGDGFVDFGVFEGDKLSAKRFVDGDERSILLDFNVDGVVYDKIG